MAAWDSCWRACGSSATATFSAPPRSPVTAASGSVWVFTSCSSGNGLLAHPLLAHEFSKDVGWILLAFAIFNTYMLIWSTQVNAAIFAVFLTLEATEIILFIGNLSGSSGTVKFGGYIGVLTALCAWYASAAGVANGMGGRFSVPVGRPLIAPRASERARSGPARS